MRGTVVGKLEGDPATVRAITTSAARTSTRTKLEHGVFFDQDWAEPAQGDAGGLGRHPRRPDASAARLSRRGRVCCSSAAAPSATRWASRPARRQPRRARSDDQGAQRGPRHLERRAANPGQGAAPPARRCAQALDTWKDVTFNYESTDTPDFVPPPPASRCKEPDHARSPKAVFIPARSHRRADPRAGAVLPRPRAGR
jgi:ribulose-bisphosphate carboxylase large chain